MNTVAVYGTLLNGFGNHRLLEASRFLGHSQVVGFDMYSLGGFPVIVPADHERAIKTEVYEVDDRVMSSLDMLEGYPNFYNRQQVEVMTDEGVKAAWIYFMQEPPYEELHLVANGDWRAFKHAF